MAKYREVKMREIRFALIFALSCGLVNSAIAQDLSKNKIKKNNVVKQQTMPVIVDFGDKKPEPKPVTKEGESENWRPPPIPPLKDASKVQSESGSENWRPPPIPPLKDDASKIQTESGSDGWRPPPIPPLKN